MTGCYVGWVALIFGVAGVILTLYAMFWRPMPWKRPYQQLERDCEDMWEKVESHLGRISRLRRAPAIITSGSAPTAPNPSESGSPMMSRSDLLRRFRAKQASDGTLR